MKMPIKCKVISKVTPGVVAETEEDAA